ncbi:OmpA family protein [Lentzea sp. NPDC005914]|uniref:OmpA family protein n=1 Tax=Lentzea sp. NPDC005914 TaxID=3154572 RepID=UPI0033F73263
MTDDEFDEMLKARHNRFVADVAAVVRRSPEPAVVSSPVVSRIAVLSAAVRSRLDSVASRVPAFEPMSSAMWIGVTLALLGVVLAGTGQPGPLRADLPQMASAPTPSISLTVDPRAVSPGLARYGDPELVTRAEIMFAADSLEMSGSGRVTLWDVSDSVRQGDWVTVVGHTARAGSADTAVEFSRRRADSVRLVLINSGVAAERISVAGRGYQYAHPDVDAGDRRVEVAVWRKT